MELPPQQPPKGVQVLILTATIDQAGQAQRMCLGLGQSLGISSSLVVGQGDVSSELAQLSANPPHILVGTPQKLLDLLSIRSIPIDRLSLLIIDEMDQLIARNLSEYVNNLARLLPPPISGAASSRERSPAPGANGFKPFEQAASSPTRSQERQTAIFSCTVCVILHLVDMIPLRLIRSSLHTPAARRKCSTSPLRSTFESPSACSSGARTTRAIHHRSSKHPTSAA